MKKLVVLAVALIMTLSLVACGDKSNTQNDENNTFATTISGFLAQFGLTEADIMPEGATDASIGGVAEDGSEGRVGWVVADITPEAEDQ